MNDLILEHIILEQKQKFLNKPLGIKRDIDYNQILNDERIVVITGIRRSGKSTLLRQIANQINDFHYLNFDDERLVDFQLNDFQKFMTISLKHSDSRILLFDEIQNITGWERFIRRIFDEGYKVILTGSNARLLSSELATHLTGRYLQIQLFPFSFREFLNFYKADQKTITTEQKAKIIKLFDKYLENGGFPEFLKYNDPDYLLQLYEDIIYKDLIVRFNIKNKKALRQLALYIITNFTSPLSINKLTKILNLKSVNTVKDYIEYLKQVFLIFECEKYDFSLKRIYTTNSKYYVIDNGLRNYLSLKISPDHGKLLENIVFLELKRRFKQVYYYAEKNFELNFYIPNQNIAIQVSYDIESDETLERELKSFELAAEKIQIKEALILTYNSFNTIKTKNLTIQILPVWQWLLN